MLMNIWDNAVDVFFDFLAPAILFLVLFVATPASLLLWGVLWLGGKSCHAQGDKMQIEVEYSGWTGCMIKVKGTWLPWTEVVPVERDGKIVFEPKPVVRIGK